MRSVEKVALLFLFTVLVPVHLAFAQEENAHIAHVPVGLARTGEPITIEAYIEGDISPSRVAEAKLWFKTRDQDAYDFQDMVFSGNQFSGQIPAMSVTEAGVDYWIEFDLDDGLSLTYPYENPIADPVQVSVRAADVGEPLEPVTLISPVAFSEVEGRILIAVSFNQAARIIDPKKVRLKLNGRDRTREADISEALLVAVIPKLKKKGRQRLDIDYLGEDGLENLGSWSFTWAPEGQGSFRVSDYLQANFGSEGRYQKFSGFGQNIFRETFNIRLSAGTFVGTGSGRLTSEEQGTLQPQHRFLVTAGWPSFRMRYGDIKPRYNELILWGRRVRGGSLDLNSGNTRLQAVFGNMTRPLNSHILSITHPDTLDPTIADTTISPGTFRRWLGAARFSFGSPDHFMLGFMAMKAKDDITSTDYGENPKDNLVTGADMEMYLDRRRITLTGQMALSLFNDNTSEPPLDATEKFKNIIWINQYFDPLPTEGIDSTGDIQITDVAKSIIRNAFSYKGRLRIRYFGNDLQTGYKSINRSYQTMGNPTLTNDREGYFVRDRLRLFKSRLYLEGGYEHYWDNVTGKGDIRNTQDILSASISAYTAERFPDLTFGYRNTFNTNDGTFTTYVPNPEEPTILDTLDSRKENLTGVYNLSLTQQIPFMTTRNQMTLSFSSSDHTDTYNRFGKASTSGFALNLRTRYDQPWMTNVSYSNSGLISIAGLTNVSYNVLSLRGDIFLFNRTLIPYVAPRMTMASGVNSVIYQDPAENLDPTDPLAAQLYKTSVKALIVNFTKIDWMAGFRWNISRRHQIRGDVSFTQYSEKGEYEYWNGQRFSVMDPVINNDGEEVTQGSVLDRNDILAMITYQVRF